MKIYIVAEIINGDEGNPSIRAYKSRKTRDAMAKRLRAENDCEGTEDEGPNEDVLVVKQTIELED